MATAELTAAGLIVKRIDEIRTDLREAILASSQFGAGTNVGDDSAIGQILDAIATQLGELHELLQAVYDSFNVDNAEGTALDNLAGLSGVIREAATFSTAVLTLGGTPATVIPAGSQAQVPETTKYFALDEDATIGGGGTVDAQATATSSGPVEAAAGSITEITTPVSGWDTVTNAADATLGEDEETDSEYRERLSASFSIGGTSTDHAIRARVEQLADVSAAVCISNRSLVTDANGIPGTAFRVVVWPDTADGPTIAEEIWGPAGMPAGIYSDGDEEYSVTDAQGYAQIVRFSFATELEIYWDITVTSNADYPADGDDLVEAAVLAYGNGLSVNEDVLPIGAINEIYDNVPGVDHLVVLVAAGAPPGGGDTDPVDVGLTQISDHDSTRITVTS
jgi:hypothetical protein